MPTNINSALTACFGFSPTNRVQQPAENTGPRSKTLGVRGAIRNVSNLLKSIGNTVDRFTYSVSPSGRFISDHVDPRTQQTIRELIKNIPTITDRLCAEAPTNPNSARLLVIMEKSFPKELEQIDLATRFISERSQKSSKRLGIPAEQITAALELNKELRNVIADQVKKATRTLEQLPEQQKQALQAMSEGYTSSSAVAVNTMFAIACGAILLP